MAIEIEFDGEIQVGPFGGPGGAPYNFGAENVIKNIIIHHGSDAVESIMFEGGLIGDPDVVCSGQFGRRRNSNVLTDEIVIDCPSDYLTGVSGTLGLHGSHSVVKSIKFYTKNKVEYGPYGLDPGTTPFSVRLDGSVITGFHGRAGLNVDSIGFYIKPVGAVFKTEAANSVTQLDKVIKISPNLVQSRQGPWGGDGGKPFDDRVFFKVVTVHLFLNKLHLNRSCVITTVAGFKFDYWRYAKSYEISSSNWYGSSWMDNIGTDSEYIDIQLNGDEHITGIEGFYGSLDGVTVGGASIIRSLTFYTNKGTKGPYGHRIGTYFCYNGDEEIVGFFGRSGSFVDAIGVHTRPLQV